MWGTVAAGAISAVAMVLAAYAAYRGNTRAKSIEGATPSYEALDARMTKAEVTIVFGVRIGIKTFIGVGVKVVVHMYAVYIVVFYNFFHAV